MDLPVKYRPPFWKLTQVMELQGDLIIFGSQTRNTWTGCVYRCNVAFPDASTARRSKEGYVCVPCVRVC